MLLGPDDLLDDKDKLDSETSSGVIGERNIELGFRVLRKEGGGTWDLIDLAIEEKYELKEFATSTGLEVTAPFIFNDIGFRDLVVWH